MRVKFQQDLLRLEHYCRDNKLFLNPDKCFCISFTKNKLKIKSPYSINDVDLRRVAEVRDLGVTLDEGWSFRTHMERVISESNRITGFIKRNSSDFKNPGSIISLYYAFVHSKLSFASVVWNPRYNIHITRLERVQNRFLRYLGFKTATPIMNHDYNNIRSKFKILTLEYKRTIADLCMVFKIVNRLAVSCP